MPDLIVRPGTPGITRILPYLLYAKDLICRVSLITQNCFDGDPPPGARDYSETFSYGRHGNSSSVGVLLESPYNSYMVPVWALGKPNLSSQV
jgi:hypothetical protein